VHPQNYIKSITTNFYYFNIFIILYRAWEYRQGKKVQKVARPTRTDKAHKLGYKAKQVMADAIVTLI
jgi:ribosomal protein L15E